MRNKFYFKVIAIITIMIIFIIPNFSNANVIEYRGKAEGIIIAPKDFFSDFGKFLPGDTKEEKAIIKNSTNSQIEVFFKTEDLNDGERLSEIDKTLLEDISLKITLKNSKEKKEIYNGNLGAESLRNNYISLGTYEKGFDGELIFEVSVPSKLNSLYALSEVEVKWVFAVEDYSTNENGSSQNGSNGVKNNSYEKDNQTNKNSSLQNIINNVKTGDYIQYVIGLIIILIIINVVILCIRRKKKNEK